MQKAKANQRLTSGLVSSQDETFAGKLLRFIFMQQRFPARCTWNACTLPSRRRLADIIISAILKIKTAFATAFVLLTACNNSSQHSLSVRQINDSVISLTNHYQDTSKFQQAINLIDVAILIDSNDIESYRKKVFFETALGDFHAAVKTSTQLVKFRPDSADLYFQRGLFKELINDSLTSKSDFSKAVLLYKLTLDTMSKRNPYWFAYWKNSAACLILAGQGQIIHDFLKHKTTAFDSSIYDINVLSKNRNELLQTFRDKYIR
jgi:tetratricopeptide (TPR) repeat protein